jgi:hypothetical protein
MGPFLQVETEADDFSGYQAGTNFEEEQRF